MGMKYEKMDNNLNGLGFLVIDINYDYGRPTSQIIESHPL